jgi:hypothetical protein
MLKRTLRIVRLSTCFREVKHGIGNNDVESLSARIDVDLTLTWRSTSRDCIHVLCSSKASLRMRSTQ